VSSVSETNQHLGLGAKNLVWERDRAIESSDRTSARSNVEGYRQHADRGREQFVLHTEEQIAAGIKFSGQDQLRSCVECFWKQPSSSQFSRIWQGREEWKKFNPARAKEQ
jgi:hypothetical protein